MRGDTPLSCMMECFSLYWNRVHEKGDNAENIAKVEKLHIAVDAYESGYFSKKELCQFIHQYSLGVTSHQHEINECPTKAIYEET